MKTCLTIHSYVSLVSKVEYLRFSSQKGWRLSLHHYIQSGSGTQQDSSPMCIRGSLPRGGKQLEHEADHSPPSSAMVKKCMELYLHFRVCLHRHRDKITLCLQSHEQLNVTHFDLVLFLFSIFNVTASSTCLFLFHFRKNKVYFYLQIVYLSLLVAFGWWNRKYLVHQK
jgi:hypothetical protein